MMTRPYYNTKIGNKSINNGYFVIAIDNSLSMHNFIENNLDALLNEIILPIDDNSLIDIITLDNYNVIYKGRKKNINISDLTISKSYMNNDLNDLSTYIKSQNNNKLNNHLYIISDSQRNLLKENKFLDNINFWNITYINSYKDLNNLSVYNVYTEDSFIIPNTTFNINVQILNNGKNNIENRLIELYVNDISVGKKYVNINESDYKDIKFNLSLPDFGKYKCHIKSSFDDIIEDNIFYFTIDVKDNILIDIIDNTSNIFLKNILNSYNVDSDIIKINYFTYDNYINSNINSDLLFLIGENNINENLISKINQYSRNNKFKIFLWPTLEDSTFLNFNNVINDKNLIGAKRVIVPNNNYLEINFNNIRNESLKKVFSGNLNRNIKVFNYLKMNSNINTLLMLNNNNFLLNYYEIDNIQLYLFSVSLDLKSTNMPIKGNIIPLIKNLMDIKSNINYYSIDDNIDRYYKISNSLINSPSGQTFSISENSKSNLKELGIYNYTNKTSNSFFAVNIDSLQLNDKYLLDKNSIREYLNNDINIINYNENVYENIRNTIIGYELWVYFLLLVFILLFLEMILSTLVIKNE